MAASRLAATCPSGTGRPAWPRSSLGSRLFLARREVRLAGVADILFKILHQNFIPLNSNDFSIQFVCFIIAIKQYLIFSNK
jgi:hypothetical protein